MDHKTFAGIFNETISRCDDMLVSKAEEYAPGADKLHNFRVAAALEGGTMREALGGMLVKHIVSVFDMIGEEEPRDIATWDEKITDSINYLILLKAIVVEELEEATPPSAPVQAPLQAMPPARSSSSSPVPIPRASEASNENNPQKDPNA